MKKQKTYLINVTKRDIENGECNCAISCPVAKALRRKFKNSVVVGAWRIHVSNYPSILQPAEVHEFINRFDEGKKVKPFKFKIEI